MKKVFILIALLSAGSCRSEIIPMGANDYSTPFESPEAKMAAEAAWKIANSEAANELRQKFVDEMTKPERQEAVKEIVKKAIQGLVFIFGGRY